MTPVLERIASEQNSGIILAKVNTRANPQTVVKNSIRSTPTVRIFRNGKMVEGFIGGRLEHQVRNIVAKVIESEPPAPSVKLAEDPARRFGQGKSHLKKGRGFEAAIALRNFPANSPLAAQAATLLPLARFLWDLDDGDRWTGKRKIDDHFESVLDAFDDRDLPAALPHLQAVLTALPKDDQAEFGKVIKALESLIAKK